MLDGGGDVAGMKGLLVALECIDGFGGDAELADRDRVGGGPSWGCGIGSGARGNGGGGVGGSEGGGAVVCGGRMAAKGSLGSRGVSPSLTVAEGRPERCLPCACRFEVRRNARRTRIVFFM